MSQFSSSDNLFTRLQEENARIAPQESTVFILAQIERQNAMLEKDPKSICMHSNKLRAHFSTVQQLVTDNTAVTASSSSFEHSNEDIDWDFWEAVIQDFDRVACKMPHLLSIKLHAGIPDRVRGLIWQAMSKSASLHLETVYGQLCRERSPHERIIQRDLARTFPCIDMFKQENGKGQLAMRRILEAYSLYDADVGYCQGLAFLVGPLLMHMEEVEAFCVFVRLMETYEMRTMFTLNMEGLQLRLYQFTRLLQELLPELAAHLDAHGVQAAMYASQWFLTLFAYGFPINFVKRIYDIIFAEGAVETIMRVAIAMLTTVQYEILQETEFEDLLDKVACRNLGDAEQDKLIAEATHLSNIITRARMEELSEEYKHLEDKSQAAAGVLDKNKTSFWRRGGSFKKKMRKASVELKRSTSAKTKRWSSISLQQDAALPPPPPPPQQQQQRSSFTSTRMSHEEQIERLSRLLAQMHAKHREALEELEEIKLDKRDIESERDALKATIVELEKRLNSYKCKRSNSGGVIRSQTVYDCQKTCRLPRREDAISGDIDSIDSNGGPYGDAFSDITNHSTGTLATTATAATADHDEEGDDDGDLLRAEVVRLKVENFELQQQCEKLTQTLDDVQSKLDMVNDGQMALVDKLITTKSDMDELLKQKKRKDLEWLEVTRENAMLKEVLIKQLQRNRSTLKRRHSADVGCMSAQNETTRITSESLVEAKVKLIMDPSPQVARIPSPAAADDDDVRRRSAFELSNVVKGGGGISKRSFTTIDNHASSSLPRSSSIYSRVWHAISPRSSSAVRSSIS